MEIKFHFLLIRIIVLSLQERVQYVSLVPLQNLVQIDLLLIQQLNRHIILLIASVVLKCSLVIQGLCPNL